jgi:hypothetical protein
VGFRRCHHQELFGPEPPYGRVSGAGDAAGDCGQAASDGGYPLSGVAVPVNPEAHHGEEGDFAKFHGSPDGAGFKRCPELGSGADTV